VTTYTFVVPGKPKGKPRPGARTNPKTGKAFTYQPGAGEWRAEVASLAMKTGMQPVDGPVFVNVKVTKRIADSWTKKKKAEALSGERWCIATPDSANVQAEIHDALEGVAAHNDRQIVGGSFERRWGERDYTEIEVTQG